MQFKTAQFEGPLDLLLNLIQERKLEVTDVALSEVTEQYLGILETMNEDQADELADFLVIASKLVLLKSKSLLPNFFPEEEEEENLADQLRLYKAFVEASRKLQARWLKGPVSAFREHPVLRSPEFHPPQQLSLEALHGSMHALIERLTPPKPLPKVHIDPTVSIKEKIQQLREKLQTAKQFFFHETLANQRNTSEVVVGFLAMLELVKQRSAEVQQESAFSDIMIERV